MNLDLTQQKPSQKPRRGQSNSGQIIVEYILIVAVTAVVGATLVRGCVSRDPDNPGLLTSSWSGMLETIAEDYADHTE